MHRSCRFWSLIVSAVICLSAFVCPIGATEDASVPLITDHANAVYFYHIESNTLVFEKNADTEIAAGSTVKVISGLLFCEALADSLSETVLITDEMVSTSAGYRLYLKSGDTLTVEDLLYAAICASYNDAYDVLAVYIAGSKEAFLAQMNARAAELGCNNTLFTDTCGVNDASRTDASDLFLIARVALENALYMQISSTLRYSFSGSSKLNAKTFYNRNALLSRSVTDRYYNSKCAGMSAGFTELGGGCVVTSAKHRDQTYLCIVMGAPEIDEVNYGYAVTNSLINWGFDAYEYVEILTPESVVCTIPVTVSDMTTEVDACVKESLTCFLPKNANTDEDISFSIRLLHTELEAPVAEGTMVGYVAVIYGGKTLGILPLYTAGSAERGAFAGALHAIQSLTRNRAFIAGAIFFCTVLLLWIVTETVIRKRRRTKWDKYFSMKMDPAPNSLRGTHKPKRPPTD